MKIKDLLQAKKLQEWEQYLNEVDPFFNLDADLVTFVREYVEKGRDVPAQGEVVDSWRGYVFKTCRSHGKD